MSPWVLQLNGKTSIWISSSLSFSYHFPSPERNCWPIVPRSLFGGPHPGERHVRASWSTTRASMGLASVRTGLKRDRVHHIDPADALKTSGFPCLWFASSTSMVSSKVLPIGIEGHGLPFCGQNARPGLPGPRLPSVQQMNKIPCWIFEENFGCVCLKTGYSAFFWSTLCSVPCVFQ